MINLLTTEGQLTAKQEYRRRRLMVAGILLLSLLGVALVLAGLRLFTIKLEIRNLRVTASGDITSSEVGDDQSASAASQLLLLAKQESTLIAGSQHIARPSAIWQTINRHLNSKIRVTNWLWEREAGTLELAGVASTRADLLAFIAELKQESIIESVESPIENLLRPQDPKFTLTLKLKP